MHDAPAVPLSRGREGWLAPIAAGMALLIGAGFLAGGFDSPSGGDVIAIGFSLLLTVLIAVRGPGGAFWRAAAPVLLLLTVGLAWAVAVSSGLFGTDPLAPDMLPASLAARWAALAALLCGAILGSRREPLLRFVHPLLAIGMLSLVAGLALRGGGGEWLVGMTRQDGRFAGTLGNANVAAAAYGSLAILGLAAGLAQSATVGLRPDRHAMPLIAALLAFGATVATGSRAGTALTLLGMLLVGATAARGRVDRRWLGGGILLVAIAALISAGVLMQRVERIGDDVGMRPMMWRHYAAAVADAPWTGHGMGSFSMLNQRHLDTVSLGEALWSVNAPHDIWLALALEGGLVWLFLVAAAIVLMARRIVTGMRHRAGVVEVGAAGSLILILGLASVDIAFEVPALATLACVLAGWLWGRSLPRDKGRALLGPAGRRLGLVRS